MENNLKLDNKLDYIFRYDSLGQFIERLTFKKLFSLDKCAHLGFKYLSMEGTIFNCADHNIELHPDSATLEGNLIYKATETNNQSCRSNITKSLVPCDKLKLNVVCKNYWSYVKNYNTPGSGVPYNGSYICQDSGEVEGNCTFGEQC